MVMCRCKSSLLQCIVDDMTRLFVYVYVMEVHVMTSNVVRPHLSFGPPSSTYTIVETYLDHTTQGLGASF
jgi:hypothetical protein